MRIVNLEACGSQALLFVLIRKNASVVLESLADIRVVFLDACLHGAEEGLVLDAASLGRHLPPV